ncbi:hypothetical protein BHM03_00036933 [Ensete ventricosum]|nr:hypothetical protein BHM03_00036933 [Ensete ventricosum]
MRKVRWRNKRGRRKKKKKEKEEKCNDTWEATAALKGSNSIAAAKRQRHCSITVAKWRRGSTAAASQQRRSSFTYQSVLMYRHIVGIGTGPVGDNDKWLLKPEVDFSLLAYQLDLDQFVPCVPGSTLAVFGTMLIDMSIMDILM